MVFEVADDPFDMGTSVIFLADLDLEDDPPTLSYAVPIVHSEKSYATIYPKWTAQGEAILYVSNRMGTYQVYRYMLSTGATVRVSSDAHTDYTYFSPKNLPN
jgi:Tol biopolymer transport system component